MEYTLMNTDRPVLVFDEKFSYIKVLDNGFLPYSLKDYIKSTKEAENTEVATKHIIILRDYLVSRTISLSRKYAKTILGIAGLSQSTKTSERIKTSLACKGLNMEDNFWLRSEDEKAVFSDVNLRKHHLSEASYEIAILGRYVTASREELIPDLMTGGMFPKCWQRNNGAVELWKTDMTNGLNAESEVEASKYIIDAGGKCVPYWKEERDGMTISVCSCMTTDDVSLVKAQEIIDWCIHTGKRTADVISPFEEEFANMVIADYVLGNTDRHNENWGFLIDNDTNNIISLAPLYDLNQALVIDKLGNSKCLDTLIYEPCNMTFKEAMLSYSRKSSITFNNVSLPDECKKRWEKSNLVSA